MSFIYSIASSTNQNKRVKIEAKLNRGIPRVTVVGVPESVSKRILIKVKSAVLNQDFKWALSKHLMISVDPPVSAKEAEFLDFGFAVSILQEMGQLNLSSDSKLVAVGSLDLEGALLPLNFESEGMAPLEAEFWFGNFLGAQAFEDKILKVENLSKLNNLKSKPRKILKDSQGVRAYSKRVEYLSPHWQEAFEVMVHGEHSSLFLMPENPEMHEFLKILRESLNHLDRSLVEGVRLKDRERPFVQINSSATRSQILGSSGHGFYHYAHGGLAYLDHYSGVGKTVRDAIRSKVQEGAMTSEKKADVILIARNPLCPCGKAKLGKPRKCGFSSYRCRSVIEKLSADEFSLFEIVLAPTEKFFEMYPPPDVNLVELNKRKELAYKTQRARGQILPNSRVEFFTLKEMVSEEARALSYIPVVNGLDRTKSILSVARTFADLSGDLKIEKTHIEKAVLLVYKAAKEVSKAF